jgi:ATP-dependent helicase/DNAse subunit B
VPIELIVGPPNSGRSEAILSRFTAALGRDPVLVVPTAGDVTAFERELAADGATLGGSIATFDALAGEIATSMAPAAVPELTVSQRQALVRAAIDSADPGRLRRSAARPGFAPALARLIAELEGAMLSPADFAATVADLDDAGYERELAAFYARYVELRDRSGRGDRATTTIAAIQALRAEPDAWGARPVFAYGFDDLSRAQLTLIDALAAAGPVTVAVTFADRRALAPRARLISALQELGAEVAEELPFEEGYTSSATLRHLDRALFEPVTHRVAIDDGLVLLESAGARGEAEAVGVEIARLLRSGCEPDDIAIVLRHPDPAGRLLASVLREMGIPVALESSLGLSATQVGGALIALCRAAADESAVESLLAHLRLDPALAPGAVDTVEARIRRGDASTVSEAVARWEKPPRHLQRLREAETPAQRLRALARSARELAESPHRERAPLAGAGQVPFSALELRAGVAAAELLTELAGLRALPGCEVPELAGAIEAIESSSVPLWRGPATGRVRILDPYRARAARAKALFCLSLQDGVFPSAAPADPLLSEERRREIGNPDLRRTDPADEERYLFHSCVSRPTERLYLSWQGCDEDGTALARSPFLDEVCDLLELGGHPEPVRKRGPERAVPTVAEATSERDLARALALGGWAFEREPVLAAAGAQGSAARIDAMFADLCDPNLRPGPLRSPAVLADLGAREVFSANSLEGWVTCSYKWFVEHELAPQRLEPTADPLWLGSIVHAALDHLYKDPPGADSIPRSGDLDAWRERFAELLSDAVAAQGGPLNNARRAALERARAQVDAFLAAETENETGFRPRPDLLEVTFGPFEDEEGPAREGLPLGDVSLRGRIDRIDTDHTGRAVVHDYKTGKSVTPAAKFAERGTLQIQLYMRAAERILGLDVVAGLYHPLGAVGDRNPRGLVAREDEDLRGLGIVGTDRLEHDEFERALDEAKELAQSSAREMRAGEIRRHPIGGRCPKYCNFQAICRLERAIGVDENGNGG